MSELFNKIKILFQSKKHLLRFYLTENLNKKIKNICINPKEFSEFNYENILVFAPHPDDEILGCVGTLLRLQKYQPHIPIYLYLFSNDSERLQESSISASESGLRIINEFDEIIKKCDLIFLPSYIENHSDHITIFNKVVEFMIENKIEQDIFLYNIWSVLHPNIVVDITEFINKKIELISHFKSQLKNKNYAHIIKGLNAYYSIYLKNSYNERFAEIFFKCSVNDLRLLFKI